MSFSGDETWLLYDKIEREYGNYVFNEEAKTFIINNYPNIDSDIDSRNYFLIHYDLMMTYLKEISEGFASENKIISDDIKEILKDQRNSKIKSPVLNYIIVEKYGLKEFHNAINS